MDNYNLVWIILGLLLLLCLLYFAYFELKAFFNKRSGDTATEAMEAAIARHKAVRYGLLPAMLILGFGFLVLLPVHVYTGLW